jgi:ABC-type transport system involved in cytochrome c biogenesis ATPase subunit
LNAALLPTKLQVRGLFGHVDHDIDLVHSRANILAGPNGCGKTHTLRLLRATLALDFNELLALPYKSAALTLSDNSTVYLHRETEKTQEVVHIGRGYSSDDLVGNTRATSQHFDPAAAQELPSWLHSVDPDMWFDDRSDRTFTAREVERRFGIRVPDLGARAMLLHTNPWLNDLAKIPEPVFIDTKRLDTMPVGRDEEAYLPARVRNSRGAAARISQYTEQVRSQIKEAKSESLEASQTADERFAFNLMTMAHDTVNQGYIERQYAQLADLNAALSGNGLSGRPIDVKLRPRMNPTEKRVLNLFLQDWVKKLEPLLPIHEKLTTLRRIINEKFHNKQMVVSSDGSLEFRHEETLIPVSQLSSGEQHLIALFTQLLFSASPGSTVLIDEPEISLHAAWKHSFVADIEEVAAISNLSIIMATHSTAVINGRWEIVSELGLDSQ